jgi:hypothetical protein
MRPGVRARPTDGAGPAQPSLCSVSGHSAKTASEPVCPPQLSNQGSPRQGRDTVGGSSPSRRSAASCASQFSDPLAGPLCRNSTGRRSLRQKASKPNRASSLVGAPNWPGRWNGHGSSLQARIHRPTAWPILARLRTPIVPPLLLLLQMDHPAGPPFRRAQRPFYSTSPERPCSLPG